ncbi:alpha/beta superfamily hydrolase [Humibacillus xanthopallidus]|uniref:Alpha/beta superfamily hydrolase n=1 Tax=Humibacillus xanthopallidus TaxID=412689 RepID=A0A543PLT1_9MICO|nr:alpha/beta fold hydrolase [Humibacillus xanthopallidus]TQN45043.1 alpha/beta superfamily hydrolase [Humibacillus xanthopallidus]
MSSTSVGDPGVVDREVGDRDMVDATDRGRMPSAALVWDAQPADAAAVVIVLHGGAVDGYEPNRPWSHNVARLLPFARSLRSVPGPLAVARVRFRFRGWNGDEQAPLVDARWALEQVRTAYPGRPVAVVGHSMGGRVALHLGAERDVRLVVALAPWIERRDTRPGPWCRTVVIHGDRDVICGLSRSRRLVEELQAQGRDASLIRVARGDHAMLLRPRLWTELVTGVVASSFAGELGIADDASAEPRSGEVGAAIALAVHGGGSVIDL